MILFGVGLCFPYSQTGGRVVQTGGRVVLPPLTRLYSFGVVTFSFDLSG